MSENNLRPLHDRIVIEREEIQDELSAGGIYIPDSAKEKPMAGTVVAVGPGKILQDGTRSTVDVQAGDKVLFGKYAGTETKLGEKTYLVMREEDIMGVIESVA